MRVRSLGGEDPLERKWQPTPVFLPGASHGQRSLEGCSPWGPKGSDTTEAISMNTCTASEKQTSAKPEQKSRPTIQTLP